MADPWPEDEVDDARRRVRLAMNAFGRAWSMYAPPHAEQQLSLPQLESLAKVCRELNAAWNADGQSSPAPAAPAAHEEI